MSSFSDNFDGGSGNLDARTGWGTTRDSTNNTVVSSRITLASNVATRNTDPGEFRYILADFVPGSADYIVSVDLKMAVEVGHLYGPFVRGAVGATGATGYTVDISAPDDLAGILKWANGVETAVGTAFGITARDWTTFHAVKLDVSGGATTTIKLYIDGTLEGTRTDSSSPITAAGLGGIQSYYNNQVLSWDNFLIDDGISGGAAAITNYLLRKRRMN